MKQAVLISITLLAFCISVLPQKLNEPHLLGTWIGGEDPSEFLLHRVMERSQIFLKDNAEGKLIVRVCGSDDFSTAFVKAPINPLWASRYNKYWLLVPYEKIFIANSAKCFEKKNFIFNEYWFIPNENTLEYDNIIPVNDVDSKKFWVDDYDYERNKRIRTSEVETQFTNNIKEFISELKKSEKSEGFIVYRSMTKKLKRNIEKVKALLMKENVDLQRVKTVMQTYLEEDKNGKLVQIKDKTETFPALEIVTIKQ